MVEVVMRSKSLLNQCEFRWQLPIEINQDLLNCIRENAVFPAVSLAEWGSAGNRMQTDCPISRGLSYENSFDSGNDIGA
ncbi:hypothetical protein [Pandoraea sp. SD6-2]|uniref:hypothetical protein n=1 Tax=Pandoraea sp. SD6-2 TaxID=1286093 RepID=UPI00118631CB|nr:hypothetical protein [Pandoraea sp. SD6-2]